MKELDQQVQYDIAQVKATMAIEDMAPDSRTLEDLEKIAFGEKTADHVIKEIIEEYKNG
jgi:hypothetical protein